MIGPVVSEIIRDKHIHIHTYTHTHIHQKYIYRYNNNSNNSYDSNNKCKKVYECFSFIENVFQCSQMSSELGTELNHERSTNVTEILELYLIMN